MLPDSATGAEPASLSLVGVSTAGAFTVIDFDAVQAPAGTVTDVVPAAPFDSVLLGLVAGPHDVLPDEPGNGSPSSPRLKPWFMSSYPSACSSSTKKSVVLSFGQAVGRVSLMCQIRIPQPGRKAS